MSALDDPGRLADTGHTDALADEHDPVVTGDAQQVGVRGERPGAGDEACGRGRSARDAVGRRAHRPGARRVAVTSCATPVESSDRWTDTNPASASWPSITSGSGRYATDFGRYR